MDNDYVHNGMDDYAARLESMYPDVFRRMSPHIDSMVDELGPNHNITEDELNRMAYQAVRYANMGNDPPRGHNENTLGDIAKLLILSRLFDGAYDNYYPYPYPYFFPMIPFGHRGFRGGMHGNMHGGMRRGGMRRR